MANVNAKCTNCGAAIIVESMDEAVVCQQCGKAIIVKKAIDYFNYGTFDNNNQPPQNQQVMVPKKSVSSAILKITIAVVLVIALIVGGIFVYDSIVNKDDVKEIYSSEGNETTGALSGEYVSESGLYKIKFKDDFTCIWYQEVYGYDVFFDGTYELEDEGVYVLNMDGETYSLNTEFKAVLVEDGLIVTGGVVNGELFVKQ